MKPDDNVVEDLNLRAEMLVLLDCLGLLSQHSSDKEISNRLWMAYMGKMIRR